MEIELRKKGRVCVLNLTGRLPLGQGDVALRHKFQEVLDAGERQLLLNLSGLNMMDSAGVGEFVACSKRAFERAAIVKVTVQADSAIARIFSITGLERAYEVFTDEDSAVASYSS
jgi:anti-sigma B factor antagonist